MSDDRLRPVVALVPDLMDRSRVQAALSDVRFVSEATALAPAAAEVGADATVLVDLARTGAVEAAAELVAAGLRVVGFGAHVDTALLDRARGAGLEVHPRSKLFRDLAELVAGARRDPDELGDTDTSAPLIPVEHLFENPERTGAQISPDGAGPPGDQGRVGSDRGRPPGTGRGGGVPRQGR